MYADQQKLRIAPLIFRPTLKKNYPGNELVALSGIQAAMAETQDKDSRFSRTLKRS